MAPLTSKNECGWRKRTRRFLQKEYVNPKAKWGKEHDVKFRRSERSREIIVDIDCALGSFQEAHESWLTEGPLWDRKFARILRHGSASGGWYEAIDRRLDAKFSQPREAIIFYVSVPRTPLGTRAHAQSQGTQAHLPNQKSA